MYQNISKEEVAKVMDNENLFLIHHNRKEDSFIFRTLTGKEKVVSVDKIAPDEYVYIETDLEEYDNSYENIDLNPFLFIAERRRIKLERFNRDIKNK